ncbi:MAG TPA: hypothetical protein VG013_11455 [Gemmataceae bacterium]|nr:hypothetical protein [Gemmataceae bacterium]
MAFNFGMIFCGTSSLTCWTVGANGLGFLTGLTWSRFRWPSDARP